MKEFSSISASLSLGVTMYSKCTASPIILAMRALKRGLGARAGVKEK